MWAGLMRSIFFSGHALQMGYGSRALKALDSFYSGEYFNLSEHSLSEPSYPDASLIDPVCSLL